MSIERLGHAWPPRQNADHEARGSTADRVEVASPPADGREGATPESAALDFVRFCYRRRAVAWPELYDEMCAVAARGAYRGLGYEQLEGLGIRFALAALPRLAEMAARVMAEERGRPMAGASA